MSLNDLNAVSAFSTVFHHVTILVKILTCGTKDLKVKIFGKHKKSFHAKLYSNALL